MGKFRKKPVVIEARQYDGTLDCARRIINWVHQGTPAEANVIISHHPRGLRIRTLEDELTATTGDWIIRSVKGEFYACKPDIFEATYEPVKTEGV